MKKEIVIDWDMPFEEFLLQSNEYKQKYVEESMEIDRRVRALAVLLGLSKWAHPNEIDEAITRLINDIEIKKIKIKQLKEK